MWRQLCSRDFLRAVPSLLPPFCRRHTSSTPNRPRMSTRAFDPVVETNDLFRYTSGRWLVGDRIQQQLRYVKFNLDYLCRLAASQFSDATKCVHVKLEGNFNKTLLLTMDDGNEAIAKIPCPNAGPPSLTTASEVATLKFCMYFGLYSWLTFACNLYSLFLVRSRTSILPRIFAWSSDATNSVVAEFIIMEKVRGVALSET